MATRRLFMTVMLLTAMLTAWAQSVVSGVVTDRQTGRALSHVSVTAEGGKAHTVTNDEGYFVLKTKQAPQYLQLSHIGYKTRRHQLKEGTQNVRIMMTANVVGLHEVVITRNDPLEIVKAAMQRIENNYPDRLYLGICSQAPQSDECVSIFDQLSLTTDNVGDFRMGE